jgi:hypothetical protein
MVNYRLLGIFLAVALILIPDPATTIGGVALLTAIILKLI